MITIKIYESRQYYRNKWGDKEWLNGSGGDATLLSAAMLTGKGLDSEEFCIYNAYGETMHEAEKALENYLKANPDHPEISRKEIIEP